MQTLIRQQAFTGVKYEGKVFDCGSKIGFLTAHVVFALDRPNLVDDFLLQLARVGVSARPGTANEASKSLHLGYLRLLE
jgi:UTP--glucose-1-phosphate uridylyltransferase